MKIFYVRHGQTNWNLQNRIQGSTDNNLNDTGIEQAKITKELLKDKKFDLIICSPKIRAKQTAEIINEGRNLEIIYDDRIIERTFGESEGKPIEVQEEDRIWDYELNIKYENGESFTEFEERVVKFIEDMKKKYADKTILIVAHGGVSVIFKMYLYDIPKKGTLSNLVIGNCEILEMDF